MRFGVGRGQSDATDRLLMAETRPKGDEHEVPTSVGPFPHAETRLPLSAPTYGPEKFQGDDEYMCDRCNAAPAKWYSANGEEAHCDDCI